MNEEMKKTAHALHALSRMAGAMARAAVRVVGARWKTRHFHRGGLTLHMIPMPPGWEYSEAVDRATLCGIYVESAGDGTIQPDIVGCWGCAVAIESNRAKWRPRPIRRTDSASGLTVCVTCGMYDDYAPRCRCDRESA